MFSNLRLTISAFLKITNTCFLGVLMPVKHVRSASAFEVKGDSLNPAFCSGGDKYQSCNFLFHHDCSFFCFREASRFVFLFIPVT